MNRPEYNDTYVPSDPKIYQRLRQHGNYMHTLYAVSVSHIFSIGLDALLAKHISHLFIRDPIVIFSELRDQDDKNSMDHFEVRA